MSVLGDVAHVFAALTDGHVCYILAAQRYLAVCKRLKTGKAVDELSLAVAVNTGNADYLALSDLKADILDGVALMQSGGDGHVLYPENGLLRLCGGLDDLELNGTADHHVGQLLLVRVLRVDGADISALAQDGDSVGDLHYLVELMGNKENGFALCRKILHDLHELFDLLRRKHGRRLVEYKDLIVTVKHLEDLGALLHTDGYILYLCIKVDLKAVALGKSLDLLAGFLLLEESHLRVLSAEDDVVQNREHFNKLEVLMHHAYVKRGRIVRVVDLDFDAVFADLTLLGLIKAEQHAHQCGFAGAVFAEKSMDLALAELQGNVVICLDTGELLGYMEHFNYIFV